MILPKNNLILLAHLLKKNYPDFNISEYEGTLKALYFKVRKSLSEMYEKEVVTQTSHCTFRKNKSSVSSYSNVIHNIIDGKDLSSLDIIQSLQVEDSFLFFPIMTSSIEVQVQLPYRPDSNDGAAFKMLSLPYTVFASDYNFPSLVNSPVSIVRSANSRIPSHFSSSSAMLSNWNFTNISQATKVSCSSLSGHTQKEEFFRTFLTNIFPHSNFSPKTGYQSTFTTTYLSYDEVLEDISDRNFSKYGHLIHKYSDDSSMKDLSDYIINKLGLKVDGIDTYNTYYVNFGVHTEPFTCKIPFYEKNMADTISGFVEKISKYNLE